MRATATTLLTLAFVLAGLSACLSVPLSEPRAKPPPGGAAEALAVGRADPGAIEVHLTDGSVLKLVLAEDRLQVRTPYGALAVPVGDVQHIELAPREPEAVARRIQAAIGNLGSADPKLREAAAAQLFKLGEKAYPALVRAGRYAGADVARPAAQLADKLRPTIPAGRVAHVYDVVYTADATITGWIETASWRAHTWQFGDVRLRLADIHRLRSLASPDEADGGPVAADPGNLSNYDNQIGKTFRFRVTGAVNGSVWGTDVYTTDSTLSTAAVHAGVLGAGQAGVVRVTIMPSPPMFVGSTRNGVTSSPWPAFPAAFKVSR
jgi:hypothetical protein